MNSAFLDIILFAREVLHHEVFGNHFKLPHTLHKEMLYIDSGVGHDDFGGWTLLPVFGYIFSILECFLEHFLHSISELAHIMLAY
jgi:hypothetical protein